MAASKVFFAVALVSVVLVQVSHIYLRYSTYINNKYSRLDKLILFETR